MAGASYNKAETALTEARKNTYCAIFHFAVCLQSQYLIFFSVHVMSLNTKYLVVKCILSRLKMHQNRFRPGLCPGPRWGSLRRSPRPPSRLGRGTPLSHSPPPRRLRRLDRRVTLIRELATLCPWSFLLTILVLLDTSPPLIRDLLFDLLSRAVFGNSNDQIRYLYIKET